ncbi:MAG: GNAT family N-acetyltransferase [Candidatus ainarchaeum sp.]|jgi:GNAT superfamily N-acetyltransferase|nr:GNAT family N-acetyltransferase [Candidatus ainarchaeum sp.]
MSEIKYKLIDYNNFSELTKETLIQVHDILKKEASWNDTFSEFKKRYTKSNFKNTKLFLVFESTKLAGFIEGYSIGDKEFYAKSFYVSSEFRNKNIGTKLKGRVLAHLKKLGYKKYSDGLVVNPLVSKISDNLIKRRKKESLKKQPKLTFPYGFKDKGSILFKNIKKRKPGKK